MKEKLKYTIEDNISSQFFPFWEVPTFIGNNLDNMIECPIGDVSKGFICDVVVTNSNSKLLKGNFKALFDTGASKTCISDKVITELKLEWVGDTLYTTFEGKFEKVGKYAVDIAIDNVNADFQINCPKLPTNNRGIDIVIGLDIIQLGELFITQNLSGKCILKFDVPKLPISH